MSVQLKKSWSPMRTKRKPGAVPNGFNLEKGPTKEQKQRRSLQKGTRHLLEDDPMKVEDDFTHPAPSRHSLRRSMLASTPNSKPVRRSSSGSTEGQKLPKNDSSQSLPGLNRNEVSVNGFPLVTTPVPLKKSLSPMGTKRKTGAVPNRSYLEKGPTKEQKHRRGLLKNTLRLENDPMKVEDNFTHPAPSSHALRRSMLAGKPKSKPVRRFSFGSTRGQNLRKNDSSHSLPVKVEDKSTHPAPSSHALRRSMLAGKPRSKPVRRCSFGSTGGQKLRKNDSFNSLPGLNRNDKAIIERTGQDDADKSATPYGIMSNALRRVIERQGKGTIMRAKTDGTDLMAMRRSLQNMNEEGDDSFMASEESGSGFLERGLAKLENLYETCQ